jgi:hypothetical protein
VAKALRREPTILSKVEKHLHSTALFLRQSCGIRSPEIVPYTAHIVLLAAAFAEVPGLTADVGARLRDWLWLTTYSETFQRQTSESRFSQILEDVRRLARGERLLPVTGRPRPERRPLVRFDFRHARARGLALLLANQAPRDPSHPQREATKLRSRKLLAEHGAQAMQQLVSSSMTTAEVAGRAGARVLVAPELVHAMRRMLQGGKAPPTEFLDSHLIGQEAWGAFRAGDYAKFVELREEDLNRLEEQRFERLVRRLYPPDQQT